MCSPAPKMEDVLYDALSASADGRKPSATVDTEARHSGRGAEGAVACDMPCRLLCSVSSSCPFRA